MRVRNTTGVPPGPPPLAPGQKKAPAAAGAIKITRNPLILEPNFLFRSGTRALDADVSFLPAIETVFHRIAVA